MRSASIFTEMVDFFDFFSGRNKEARDLVFYSEHGDYRKFFQDLIQEILGRSSLKLCYITSDPKDPFLKEHDARINVFYMKHLLPFLLPFLNAKALVMTMPDLHQFHLRRSVLGTRHIYMFHAMMSTHMIYRRGAFDFYDTIFCVGPHHVEEIRRSEEIYGLRPKDLFKTGYFLLDRIYQDHQAYLSQRSDRFESGRKVLIAPSWAAQNILQTCFMELVEVLAKHDYQMIVRPHPEFLKRQPEDVQRLVGQCSALKGVTFELHPASERSLHEADVLITDWSGIALEYAFGTERPVLYIDTPRKINNPEYEKLGLQPLELRVRDQIGRVLALQEVTRIHEALDHLMQNRLQYREKILQLRNQYVYNFGCSSAKAADYLIDLCHPTGNAAPGSGELERCGGKLSSAIPNR